MMLRYLLTVGSHRGQETFNVPVMGCMNSIAYVQRQIDRILRPLPYAKAYIDDIVSGAKKFHEYLSNLRELFTVLVQYNVSISPKKTFLGYPSVNLLGRHVDSLGLATAEDKLAAIKGLTYPTTLGKLEHYLGLTGYMRSSVYFYAQLAAPLQELKTRLLKDSPASKGRQRKKYSSSYSLDKPIPAQQASFDSLQLALIRPSILIHFDENRPLWIDLDASKEFGFSVIIFHVKENVTDEIPAGKWPTRSQIQPIMFLSRLLTDAEKNYWPTELEIAGFVWVIKKLRHIVESSKYPVIIQTDHSAILDIIRQSSITTTISIMRMNVRLVRASQFLRQFQLDVRHKPGKEHIIPDVLSRLASTNSYNLASDHSELDCLFTASYVRMKEEFYDRILKGYDADPAWRHVIKTIDNTADETRHRLPFVRGRNLPPMDSDPYFAPRPGEENSLESNKDLLASDVHDDLIYHVDKYTGHYRVCVPNIDNLVKEILQVAHGDGHPGYNRCLETVSKSWYVRHLAKQLREYLRHCPQCLVYQTRRHRPYGVLEPIQTPSVPFHTITLDFILGLPMTDDGLDCTMLVTDKYCKRNTFVPGQSTWKAPDWAAVLLDRLSIAD